MPELNAYLRSQPNYFKSIPIIFYILWILSVRVLRKKDSGAWRKGSKATSENKSVSLKWSWIQINAHTQRSAHSMQTLAAHIFGKHRESNSNINLAFNMINCTTFSLYERRLLECSSFHSFFFVRVFCTPYTLFINIIDSPCVYRCSRNFFCYCLCFAIKIRQLQHKYRERERIWYRLRSA